MTWRQHPLWRTGGILVLMWLLLNLPALLGGRILPWDAIDQFYPTVYFNAYNLRHGIAPWWNPHIYAGYPQIADPQGMLFSPLLMAWMLIPSSPGAAWFIWGCSLQCPGDAHGPGDRAAAAIDDLCLCDALQSRGAAAKRFGRRLARRTHFS